MNYEKQNTIVWVGIAAVTGYVVGIAFTLSLPKQLPCVMNYSQNISWMSSAIQEELDDVDDTVEEKERHLDIVDAARAVGQIVKPYGKEFYVPEHCYAENVKGLVILWRK